MTQVMIISFLSESKNLDLLSAVKDKLQELVQANADPETTLEKIEQISE